VAEQGTDAYGGLEIDEDYPYQRLEWRIERAWWFVLLGLLVAAVLGVFGGGAVSGRDSRQGALEVEWERFVRRDAAFALDVTARGQETVTVVFDARYLELVRVRSVEPEPESVDLGTSTVAYTFRVAPGGSEVRARFWLEAQRAGTLAGDVAVGQDEVSIEQFVYP
jgi:hypothetical protein